MLENKRTIQEVIALYTLEHSLKDIYVEGNLDKVVYGNYIKSSNLNIDCRLIESIDTQGAEEKYFNNLDRTSNRDKIILLSRILVSIKTKSKVICIADKDLDFDLSNVEVNKFLARTDFSCLEAYYYSERILNRFLDFCFQNLPFTASHIISQLSPILRFYFVLRIVRVIKRKDLVLPVINKMVKINKKNGEIEWDADLIINAMLLNNKIKGTSFKDEFHATVNQHLSLFKSHDIRNTLNGHDLIDLLFYYLNCIKNTNKFKEENFHRAFLLSSESSDFESHELFKMMKSF